MSSKYINTHRVCCGQTKISGFSIVESVIVLSIIAILIMTSVPSFSKFITETEIKNVSYNLSTSLNLARQYAISHSIPVHLCGLKSIKSIECHYNTDFNSNWSYGWIVFADKNDNNQYDESEPLINVVQNARNVNVVFNQRGRLRFFQDGSARSAGFYLCKQTAIENRHIRLLYSGRARVSKSMTEKQQLICNSV